MGRASIQFHTLGLTTYDYPEANKLTPLLDASCLRFQLKVEQPVVRTPIRFELRKPVAIFLCCKE